MPAIRCCRQAVKKEAEEGEKEDPAGGGAGDPAENGKQEEASKGDAAAAGGATAGAEAMDQDEEEDDDDDEAAAAMMPIRGPLPPQDGSWASCIRLLDPVEGTTVECLELGERARRVFLTLVSSLTVLLVLVYHRALFRPACLPSWLCLTTSSSTLLFFPFTRPAMFLLACLDVGA